MTSIAGTLHWIPMEAHGPTAPFLYKRICAFAYVGSDLQTESAILVEGLEPGKETCAVEAHWVDGYPELAASQGDVVTLIAAHRPIATIEVGSVRAAA
ncbi:hypothetical protein [Pseudofrankia sp. BMG5.36]|uniref:hypothetical protein n=1 Tax=Pseudofrankia sp. BMG5.36 TaxID=1834512 RepID=UPI0008DB1A64|nr:hypothetical protein [Pseudofrankia sp. BMG5.36]OHV43822.1 hypothetical protein BCD48_26795 [Pseudofrankia sp. BMG5.36]